MKRQERHHLKENELVHSIEATRDFMETRKREIGMGVVAVVVIAAIVVGALVYRQSSQSRGSELLAEAMVALNARVVPAGRPDLLAGLIEQPQREPVGHLVARRLQRVEAALFRHSRPSPGDDCRQPTWAATGLGKTTDARASYERALALTQQEPQRRFLERRLTELLD